MSNKEEWEETTLSNIWHDINPQRITADRFDSVVEISKGSKMKYELDKGAYSNEANAEWFEGFNESVADMLFTNKCMEYADRIETDEELIATVDMSAVKPNYYY